MPGLGRKAFAAGDVLTAADLQGYAVDQSIMVFGGTAARGSAISSPSEGMFTYLSDSNTLQYYNGTSWVDSYSATNGAAVTNRNLIYNGAMQVAQRGTSTAGITTQGYYTADRWSCDMSNLGTWTASVENDAPTGSGLRKSHKVLCTTAKASPSANDYFIFWQGLEGQDLQRIAKGTASAQQLTLSFWVKSNVTGTYIAELRDVDNNRYVSAAYTISASATWEKKTITFPADTTGAFDNDNGGSLYVTFGMALGSTFTSGTLATSWTTPTSANRYAGQTNLAAATNNYWQVTGVQLEVGPVATSFEFKSYGQELRECQRYYVRFSNTGGSNAYGIFAPSGFAESTTQAICYTPLPVTMRVVPTAVERGGVLAITTTTTTQLVTATAMQDRSTNSIASVTYNVASGLTATTAAVARADNSASAYLGFSAEL